MARCARETGAIVTAEDHNIHGGLGGAVAEALAATVPCPVEFVGVKDTFGASGEPEELAYAFRDRRALHRRRRAARHRSARNEHEPLLPCRKKRRRHRRQPRHRRAPSRWAWRKPAPMWCSPIARSTPKPTPSSQQIEEHGPPRPGRADGCHRPRQRRSAPPSRPRAFGPDLDPGQQCRHQQAHRFRPGRRTPTGTTILDTNLKGPFIVAQTFLPLLKEAGGGAIIHIGSVSGQYGGPRTAHYAASKAGLISLAQVIARFGAAAQHPLQCRGGRPDRVRDGGGRHGGGQRAESGGEHHPQAHGHARRKWPMRWCSWPATPPPTSRPRP